MTSEWKNHGSLEVENTTTSLFGSNDIGIFNFDGTTYSSNHNEGLRISLVQSFLHDLFPLIYTIALSSDVDALTIPNKPYTPLTEEILLSYNAKDTIEFKASSIEDFNTRDNAFFHEHPYGHDLQNKFLKSKLDFIRSTDCTLIPDYCRGGELYIGIKDADHLQNVSLLIQVAEGTENKEIQTFHWSSKGRMVNFM